MEMKRLSLRAILITGLFAITITVQATDSSSGKPAKGDVQNTAHLRQGTEVILEGFQRGDTTPLLNVLPPSIRNRALADLSRSMWMQVGAYGSIRDYEVVGSSPLTDGRMQIIARVTFEKQVSHLRFIWYGNKLLTMMQTDNNSEYLVDKTR